MLNTDSDPSQAPHRQPPEAGADATQSAGFTRDDSVSHTPFVPLAAHAISFETLAALASRMRDGVCFLTSDGRIRYANPALRALLGRSEAELLGKRIDEFRDTVASQSEGVALKQWVVSQRVSVCQWRRADGGVFEARCALEPLVEGAATGASLLLMTPTARLARDPDTAIATETAADAAASAAERRAERAKAGRWVEVIEAVADVTLSALPVQDLIEAMLNRIRPALDLETAAVLLLNAEGSMLEARVVAGAGREFAREVRVPLSGPRISAVMTTREPQVVNGADTILRDSGLFPQPLLEAMTVRSILLTPLIVEDQVIGVLFLGASAQDHFTLDDIRLARVASARVALAVESARTRAEAVAAQRRLVTLAEAGATLVGPLDHRVIASRLVSLVAPAFADACALYLVEEDGAVRRTAVSSLAAESASEPAPVRIAVERALQRLPLEMERFIPTAELEAGPDSAGSRLAPAAITLAPVESHGHAVGALYLIEGGGRRLTPEDLTLIRELARRAAVGMEIARLYAELEQALRRVSESAVQLDTIFDSTDAGIYVTGADGRYQRVNAYGARMLGLAGTVDTPSESELRSAFELRDEHGHPVPPGDEPLNAARNRNEAVERRVTIHRFDTGVDIPVLARCAPLRDGHGQVTGAVGVLMDISGIQEIERQKDEFLGIVSHELKTPLTTLKILAQMLSRRMRASEEPRAQEQAERMTTAITRMERLISDLLDVSRIHEGKLALTVTVCDLGSICRDAVREQEIISQRPIAISLPDRESLPVHADMERLRQVVVNLLSNALKYSAANMPVSLRVRESGANYLVSVEDRGPGLPLEVRRRLFQRFYRAPGVRVQSGSGVGLGLGLFISREIVNAHDGEIWAEGEPGHGSVFTFSIPRAGLGDPEAERE